MCYSHCCQWENYEGECKKPSYLPCRFYGEDALDDDENLDELLEDDYERLEKVNSFKDNLQRRFYGYTS